MFAFLICCTQSRTKRLGPRYFPFTSHIYELNSTFQNSDDLVNAYKQLSLKESVYNTFSNNVKKFAKSSAKSHVFSVNSVEYKPGTEAYGIKYTLLRSRLTKLKDEYNQDMIRAESLYCPLESGVFDLLQKKKFRKVTQTLVAPTEQEIAEFKKIMQQKANEILKQFQERF